MESWGGTVVAVSQCPDGGGQGNYILHKWEVRSLAIAQPL